MADLQLNRSHNETVLESLCEGDLVEFKRGLYSHWGVFVGDEQIVHLAGEDNDGIDANIEARHVLTVSGHRLDKACVCKTQFWSVVGNDKALIQNDKDHKWKPLPQHEIVENALKKIGKVGYNLLYENCEHFAKWCRYGIEKSDQVESVVTGLAVGAAFGLVLGLVHGVVKYWGTPEEERKEERNEERQEERQEKRQHREL